MYYHSQAYDFFVFVIISLYLVRHAVHLYRRKSVHNAYNHYGSDSDSHTSLHITMMYNCHCLIV